MQLLLASFKRNKFTFAFKITIQKCANPLIKNNKGEKALDLAVMFGRQETVEKLLGSPDSKIYLNLTKQDKSPLHLAAKSGNVNVVRMLLSAGFNVNHQVCVSMTLTTSDVKDFFQIRSVSLLFYFF